MAEQKYTIEVSPSLALVCFGNPAGAHSYECLWASPRYGSMLECRWCGWRKVVFR